MLKIKVLGQGEPLVLLHGFGFEHGIWRSLEEHLKSKYRLYLVDLPGFGSSSYMSWLEFKASLLQSLPENFSLLGWSMGGLWATKLALEEAPRIKALISVASSPKFLQDVNWPGLAPLALTKFFHELNHNFSQALKDFIALQVGSYEYEAKEADPRALSLGQTVLGDWDLREELGALNCPVLYLFGRLDSIVPFKTLKRMQELYPQFDYLGFQRSAHTPFLSEPALFSQVLADFLGV